MRFSARTRAQSCTAARHAALPLPPSHRRYAARVLRREVQVRAEEVEYSFQDELGDLAERIEELAKSVDEGLQGTSVFLIGMMGSGKTTTGRMLSHVLKYYFFDSDSVIEEAVGGATIPEIFTENGEDGFRDLEQQVLSELASYRSAVVATGGGVVARPENWGSMQAGVTVYLEGTPELLAERVLAQDGAASRPLLAGANGGEPSLEVAAEKIQGLLNDRQASYKNADCIVQLAGQGSLGASVPEVVFRVLTSIDEKIKQSAEEREERKKFEIKYEGTKPLVDTMTVKEPYTSPTESEKQQQPSAQQPEA